MRGGSQAKLKREARLNRNEDICWVVRSFTYWDRPKACRTLEIPHASRCAVLHVPSVRLLRCGLYGRHGEHLPPTWWRPLASRVVQIGKPVMGLRVCPCILPHAQRSACAAGLYAMFHDSPWPHIADHLPLAVSGLRRSRSGPAGFDGLPDRRPGGLLNGASKKSRMGCCVVRTVAVSKAEGDAGGAL
jgi:hypothetical protein